MNWTEGNINVETALKNVAIDSVGKFAGAGVGAKLGSFILPPFGTIVGGTLGFVFGGNLANEYKIDNYCKYEMENLDKAIDDYLKKSEEIISKNNSKGATSKKAFILFLFSAFFKLTSRGTPSVVNILVSELIKKRAVKNRPIYII